MCALRYCGLEQRRVAPTRPLRCTKRQRPCPLMRAMLTSTRFTLPTESLPVLQSTSRERPESWTWRRLARRLRPLMLERGSFLPGVHWFDGGGFVVPPGLPGVPGEPGVPGAPGVLLPPGLPPPGAAGIASSTGCPTLPSSSTAWTLRTAPAGGVTFFENAPPPAVGLPSPRSTTWPSTFVTYFVAAPQTPSPPGPLTASARSVRSLALRGAAGGVPSRS